MIKQQDALQFLKEQPDYSVDILFCDPPYALGSEITIRKDGKPDYAKAVDFMNKWEMPDGKFWEDFYKEAFRVLKYGGHCLMYGMDRQNFMFKYYGHLAGFTGKQSLYWYFISNFPKASDLSKMIDKNAGAEREVVENKEQTGAKFKLTQELMDNGGFNDPNRKSFNITTPSTPLSKKYSGYKYSIAPLKQVVEEIMVFQKPMKTGSVLHDTLAMENGDESITCGALNIDGNRVATSEDLAKNYKSIRKSDDEMGERVGKMGFRQGKDSFAKAPEAIGSGRYPAQAFITGTEDILDKQSGVKKGSVLSPHHKTHTTGWGKDGELKQTDKEYGGDFGGCSKVLHKCPYETEEYDLFNYCPKVSKSERNAGCEEMEDLEFKSDVPVPQRAERPFNPIKNNHPTLKPISLNEKILRLFKTPNPQKILIPFAGSGSEIIGAYKAGFRDIQGCEINEEYIKIAQARIKHWTSLPKQETLLTYLEKK